MDVSSVLWERLLTLRLQFILQTREHFDVNPHGRRVPCVHQTMSSRKLKLFG
jgi:hypothetical protein